MLNDLHDMLTLLMVFGDDIAKVRTELHTSFGCVVSRVKPMKNLGEVFVGLVFIPIRDFLRQEGWSNRGQL